MCVWLCVVILVRHKKGQNRCSVLGWPVTTCKGNGCSPAVACGVFGGVLFRAVQFPHEMYWIRSGTELSQFFRLFPTYYLIWY